MEERIDQDRRDRLVEMFTNTAELLTNGDALEVVRILENACRRASAELEEGILEALINGEEIGDDPTPDPADGN